MSPGAEHTDVVTALDWAPIHGIPGKQSTSEVIFLSVPDLAVYPAQQDLLVEAEAIALSYRDVIEQ